MSNHKQTFILNSIHLNLEYSILGFKTTDRRSTNLAKVTLLQVVNQWWVFFFFFSPTTLPDSTLITHELELKGT